MSWTDTFASSFPPWVRDRGASYFARGRVRLEEVTPETAKATVGGSRPYHVRITRRTADVGVSCTCPAFGTEPCKHVWATLVALDQREDGRQMGGFLLDVDDAVRDPKSPEVPRSSPFLPASVARGARSERRQEPSWRSRLEAITSATPRPASGSDEPHWPAGREVVYEIDLRQTLAHGELKVDLFHRHRRRDGAWSKQRPLGVYRSLLATLPDAADRKALGLLLGARHGDHYYYGYEMAEGVSSFRLPDELGPLLLPALCATGRCVARTDEPSNPEAQRVPLAWDVGGAWRFVVRVRPEGGRYVAQGYLRRGEVEKPLDAPLLVMSNGLVLMDGQAAPLDHAGAFAWIADLRRHHRLELPRAEADRLAAAILRAPQPLPVELPDELRFEEVAGVPQPRLRIRRRESAFARDGEDLAADLSFVYGDADVADGQPGWCVPEPASRRVLRRDAAAEKAALDRLRALGVKRPTYRGREEGGLRLAPRRLGPLVQALTREGWRIEAEGRLYRPASAFRMRVSSGIDWFDLEAAVEFEGGQVALPRLLEALRRGESTVVLDDGSVGLLPEEWLRRNAFLAGFGTVEGDVLRFRRSQAGLLDALLAAQPAVEVDAVFETARAALRRFEGVGPVAAPEGFVGRLRHYQELGLGKTVQVLALVESRRGSAREPSLVVVPRSLVFNWKQEAVRFAPRLRVCDHTGLDRQRSAPTFQGCDVVLTTYGTLRRDAALLKDVPFDYLILDEAQAIKNRDTESAKAARLLQGRHRLALSGTPVENHLGELSSLFEFLNPGLLGRVPLGRAVETDGEARDALSRALAPFILRRTKEQVAPDLPPKTEQTLWCDLETEQQALCDELRDHYRASLLDRVDRQGLARSKMHVLEALLRLRQAACHPGLVDPRRVDGPSAKLDALVPRLAEVVEEGHKALVFSQFTSFLALLKPRLDAAGIVYEYLDGRTRDRAARVRRFEQDAGCGVFLVSLKAGGLGLNLVAAEYVFLLDPWWNPAVEAQAIDRTHRIGQTRPVFAYRLVARGTVEEKVLALQASKRALADAIVKADEGVLRQLKREDLEALLS